MPAKKKAAKPAPGKKNVKPTKSAPKKAVKKAAKPAKPAAKKAVKPVKKSAPKKAVKPKPKPSSKPVKKIVKKATKPAPKKAAPAKPAKKATSKPVAKALPKPAPKKAAVKPPVKPAVVVKPAAKKANPAPKPEVKAVAKPAPVKAPAVPAKKTEIKAPVQQAIKELKKEVKAQPKPVIKPPKTTISTSVKYQPDFTKSVLDTEKPAIAQGPLVRYSDSELQEFKELILKKLEAAKKELVYLQGLITRKDEMGGDDGDGRYMTMEDGSVSMEREQLSQMASRQITYTDHLEKALMRIENKTYGVCRVTGKLIEKARLRAVPHATLSMEAKLGQHKSPQSQGE